MCEWLKKTKHVDVVNVCFIHRARRSVGTKKKERGREKEAEGDKGAPWV
jgi:hypothetical protein